MPAAPPATSAGSSARRGCARSRRVRSTSAPATRASTTGGSRSSTASALRAPTASRSTTSAGPRCARSAASGSATRRARSGRRRAPGTRVGRRSASASRRRPRGRRRCRRARPRPRAPARRTRRTPAPASGSAVVERLLPAGQRLVHGPGVVEVALVRGEVLRLRPVGEPVARAHRDLGERGEDVELRQRERGDPVDPNRVAERDEVEPAAAPLASGDGAELARRARASRSWSGPSISVGNGPCADAGHVGLRDADDRVDPRRADPDADVAASAGDRARRGDERVGAVVEVEQRPLRALEQHLLALAQRAVDEQRGVGDVRAQPLRVPLVALVDGLERDRLDPVDPLEPHVLLGQGDLDLLAQDLRVEQVLDADPDPGRLVGVGGADPAAGGADLELAEPPLARAVQRDVPGHDQVRVPGDEDEPGGLVAARLEVVELLDQHLGVDDAAARRSRSASP